MLLILLALHCAVACQQGEIVEARWTDGTFREATIVEVRDGPGGTCGQYRLSWHHTEICEDTSYEYWGDDLNMHSFCLVSRDSIRKCRQELCGHSKSKDYSIYAGLNESESTEEDSSDRHVVPIVILVFLSLAFCCICLRRSVHHLCHCSEVDEETGMDAAAPVAPPNDLWALTPKVERQHAKASWASSSPMAKWAMNSSPMAKFKSSPMAKWIDESKKRSGFKIPSKSKAILVQRMPEFAGAPVSEASTENYNAGQKHIHCRPQSELEFGNGSTCLKQNFVQPASRQGQLDTSIPEDASGCSVSMDHVQGAALRQTAWVNTTPLRLPMPPQGSVVCPSGQLPTLLQCPTKTSLRKKPPLQGVPPQPPLVPSRKGSGKHVTWNQALEDPRA